MDISLIDGKLSRRLARRHVLRLPSGLLPLRLRGSGILRRKARLVLVYRSLARGFFGMKSSRLTENILHSSGGNMTQIHLSFSLVAKETRILAEKGGTGAKATGRGYNSSHLAFTESRLRAASPMLTLATIPTSVGHRDVSGTGLSRGEIKGSSTRDSVAQRVLPAQWRAQRPKEGDREGKPVTTSNYAAQVLQRTQEIPKRIISETKPAVSMKSEAQVLHRNQTSSQQIADDTNHGMALRSAAQVFHETEEDPGRIIGDTKLTVTMKSAAQMLHRIQESPQRLIGDARPAMALRSATQVLHRAQENPQEIFGSQRPIVVLDSVAREQYRVPGGTPLVIGQSPKIDIPDLQSGEDYPSKDYLAHQRTSAQRPEARHPSARMEYAVPPSPPIEREARPQGVVKKEEPKPPAININKLSERVYSMIESRLKIDRERRGVCG